MTHRGVVRYLDNSRGFGFVTADDGGRYHLPCRVIALSGRDIRVGDAVEFEARSVPGQNPTITKVDRL